MTYNQVCKQTTENYHKSKQTAENQHKSKQIAENYRKSKQTAEKRTDYVNEQLQYLDM